MQINQLIKTKRLEKNISQNELAHALGYSQSQFISNAERNLCRIPKAKAKKLCKILGISKKEYIKTYLSDEKKKIESYFKN